MLLRHASADTQPSRHVRHEGPSMGMDALGVVAIGVFACVEQPPDDLDMAVLRCQR
jgi:hypothetical protein